MRQNELIAVVVLFLAVLLSLGGCRATKLENACKFVNEGSSQENENRALDYQVVDAMNRNNTEALYALMSPNYVCHHPAASIDGLEVLKQSVKNAHRGLAGFNLAVHEIIAEKNMTLTRFTASGKHVGDFLGVPATGNQLKIAVMYGQNMKPGR